LAFVILATGTAEALIRTEVLVIDTGIDLLRPLINSHITRTAQIDDFILGSWVTGTSEIVSDSQLSLIPNADHAAFNLRVDGIVRATTAATRSVLFRNFVTAHVDSDTRVIAHKPFFLNASGIWSSPANAQAWTAATLQGIRVSSPGPLRRLLVTAGARRQVPASMPQGIQETSRRVAVQFSEELDREMDRVIRGGNLEYQANITNRLLTDRGTEEDRELRFWTSDQFLFLALKSDSGEHSEIPVLRQPHSLGLRVADRMIKKLGDDYFSDNTYTDADFDIVIGYLTGDQPKPADPDNQIKFFFRESDPFSISFSQNEIVLVFRCDQFQVGGSSVREGRFFPAMNTHVRYAIESHTDGGFLLRRKHMSVRPPRLEFESSQGPFTPFERQIQQILLAKLEVLLRPSFSVGAIRLTGKLEKIGSLLTKELFAENGWFGISWKKSENR